MSFHNTTGPAKQISPNQFQLQCGSHTDPSLMLETQLMYNRGFQLACGRGRRGKKRVQFPESATDFLVSGAGQQKRGVITSWSCAEVICEL